MLNLIPHKVPLTGFMKPGGTTYISVNSMLHLLTSMQLVNSKSPHGKTEYDEVLGFLKDAISNINWGDPA